jgi:DHA2 family multidrug resistance protein
MNPKAAGSGTFERVLATCGLMFATVMNALDTTIANVALPHMMGSLSASQDQITWVLTSYIVATAIMTPLSGWLALKIGRKPTFLASIAAFTGASVLCGMASNLPEMVFFRMLQGFAGASMMPLSQAAVLDLWSQDVMPRLMAVWSAVIMVGPILGPTLGGFITEHYTWRWVFYINVPVGVLAFVLVQFFLARDRGGRERPFDFLGFAALVLFTGAVQLVADRGPSLDWFDSREICIEAIVAVCALYVFVMQTLTAEHPFFHRDILVDRNFASGVVFIFFVAIVLFSTSALLPTFMQTLLGYSALQSGLASMYRGFGSLAAFAVVTVLARRIGARPTIILGMILAFVSLWQMGRFDLSMTAAPIKISGFIQGVGVGLMINPAGVLSFATLPQAHRTEAAVFSNVTRTLGASLGIAGLQAMYMRKSAAAHEAIAAHIIPSDPLIRWTLPSMFDGTSGGLERLNAEVTRQGAMIGYDAAFGGICVLVVAMLPLLLIMRPAQRKPGELVEAHLD